MWQYALTRAIPGHFLKNYDGVLKVVDRSAPTQEITFGSVHHSLTVALTLASFGIHFLFGDNDPEISHQAMRLNQRGLSHLHRKEYDQAIASFRETLQIQPEYPDALDNLGKALDATGKDAEAIADFDKAIKIAPNNAAAYADRGMALFHEGKYEEAAASYRQATEHHQDFSEAQNGFRRVSPAPRQEGRSYRGLPVRARQQSQKCSCARESWRRTAYRK